MSIADLVRGCVNVFQELLARDEDAGTDRLRDEFGRFRIWASNVSAHSTGRRSLQYRLRDSSELCETVIKYLSELLQLLRDQLSEAADPLESPGDFDDNDEELFKLEIQGSPQGDESSCRYLEDVKEITDCLFRISVALRNPARHDQIRYGETTSARHFEPYDREHVRTKFPKASEILISRLGKAISRHRQYFKYREEHHLKLAHGIDGNDQEQDAPDGLASTKATSVWDPKQSKDQHEAVNSDANSIVTATSYAASASETAQLRPPPLPEPGIDGSPFECPICYSIITTPTESAWRQHVYEDLPPYVCVSQECQAVSRQFARRRDWRKHMRDFHEQQWICPFGCEEMLGSRDEFLGHLRDLHAGEVSPDKTASFLKSCARDKASTQPLDCPLCNKSEHSLKSWYKHVGHHLEQLSLFALPSHLVPDPEADEDANPVAAERARLERERLKYEMKLNELEAQTKREREEEDIERRKKQIIEEYEREQQQKEEQAEEEEERLRQSVSEERKATEDGEEAAEHLEPEEQAKEGEERLRQSLMEERKAAEGREEAARLEYERKKQIVEEYEREQQQQRAEQAGEEDERRRQSLMEGRKAIEDGEEAAEHLEPVDQEDQQNEELAGFNSGPEKRDDKQKQQTVYGEGAYWPRKPHKRKEKYRNGDKVSMTVTEGGMTGRKDFIVDQREYSAVDNRWSYSLKTKEGPWKDGRFIREADLTLTR